MAARPIPSTPHRPLLNRQNPIQILCLGNEICLTHKSSLCVPHFLGTRICPMSGSTWLIMDNSEDAADSYAALKIKVSMKPHVEFLLHARIRTKAQPRLQLVDFFVRELLRMLLPLSSLVFCAECKDHTPHNLQDFRYSWKTSTMNSPASVSVTATGACGLNARTL